MTNDLRMNTPKAIRDRVIAAADALYRQAEQSAFPIFSDDLHYESMEQELEAAKMWIEELSAKLRKVQQEAIQLRFEFEAMD